MVMRRPTVKRWHKFTALGTGVLLVVLAIVIIIFTQTDYGRQRFRSIGLGQLTGMVHGVVELGKVHGNLLSGATIEQVLYGVLKGGTNVFFANGAAPAMGWSGCFAAVLESEPRREADRSARPPDRIGTIESMQQKLRELADSLERRG